MSYQLFKLRAGQRLTVCGKTGTGKSTFARRYLDTDRTHHWVIFNPKGTRAYDRLEGATVMEAKLSPERVIAAIRKYRVVNLKFPSGWSWQYQDAMLAHLIEAFTNIGFLIDELYYMHATNGHAGPGLTGLLSRGRELRQTFIGCCQRPYFVSKSVFTEADYVAEFALQTDDDRKMIYRQIGDRRALQKMRGHDFIFFDLAADKSVEYRVGRSNAA